MSLKFDRVESTVADVRRPATATARAGYMPQLDAVRGLAILAVVLWHFEPWSSQYMPWGQIGVRLFFVLGCFLVTANLLRARDRVAEGRLGIGAAARGFFAGRYMRLLPIYYLTLFVALALGLPAVRDHFPWHLLFATNLYIGIRHEFPPDVTHFWFLGAQEQIYLVWPFLVLALNRRRLGVAILMMIVTAPAYRAAVTQLDPVYHGYFWYSASPFANLDSIGVGALIAYLRHDKQDRWLARATGPGTGWIALALFAFGCTRPLYPTVPGPICEVALSLSFAWLVIGAARGFGGPGGAVLNAWPLRATGTVSYGLYVFHPLMPPALAALLPALGGAWPADTYLRLVLATAASYVLAALAWRLIEKPIAVLKLGRGGAR